MVFVVQIEFLRRGSKADVASPMTNEMLYSFINGNKFRIPKATSVVYGFSC